MTAVSFRAESAQTRRSAGEGILYLPGGPRLGPVAGLWKRYAFASQRAVDTRLTKMDGAASGPSHPPLNSRLEFVEYT
jgi:hypothetical protein